MVEHEPPKWLVLDGYEDEPAAFGVPPYVGFHIRYLCGVLEIMASITNTSLLTSGEIC